MRTRQADKRARVLGGCKGSERYIDHSMPFRCASDDASSTSRTRSLDRRVYALMVALSWRGRERPSLQVKEAEPSVLEP